MLQKRVAVMMNTASPIYDDEIRRPSTDRFPSPGFASAFVRSPRSDLSMSDDDSDSPDEPETMFWVYPGRTPACWFWAGNSAHRRVAGQSPTRQITCIRRQQKDRHRSPQRWRLAGHDGL